MLTIVLLFIPVLGSVISVSNSSKKGSLKSDIIYSKSISMLTSIATLFVSIYILTLFNDSKIHYQFLQEPKIDNLYNIYFGFDGINLWFVLLTVIIMPISLLSNWVSIKVHERSFLAIVLLLESLLLSVFLVLDGLLFYVSFESILPPLFLLIGMYGSLNKVKASFYLFLYTLFGSLFMLLSIVKISSLAGYIQYEGVYKNNIIYYTQLFLFTGIFIAFAIKTPTIFLNNWLLKAHVESPLSGSIILAGIVLKLSLVGIFRLMLPILSKACIFMTKFVYVIGFVTIIYGSVSTIRSIDVKELIAYSSVCHAAVYLMGSFSNIVTGIEGSILLGLAHGFVSSGLFICAGGILYDRSSTRLIGVYRGMTQIMPVFSILLFILCLGNCGVPLTLNFIGEFMSLYGIFERHTFFAPFACFSIIFSAAYTIYLFNRIAFGGSYSKFFKVSIPDVNKREFYMLLALVVITVAFGVYPAPILDSIHYSVSTLIYSTPGLKYCAVLYTSFKGLNNIWNNYCRLLVKRVITLLIIIVYINILYIYMRSNTPLMCQPSGLHSHTIRDPIYIELACKRYEGLIRFADGTIKDVVASPDNPRPNPDDLWEGISIFDKNDRTGSMLKKLLVGNKYENCQIEYKPSPGSNSLTWQALALHTNHPDVGRMCNVGDQTWGANLKFSDFNKDMLADVKYNIQSNGEPLKKTTINEGIVADHRSAILRFVHEAHIQKN